MNEQIKNEVARQLDAALSREFDLFNLPLKSRYNVLMFNGRADGTDLTPGFNANQVAGRTFVLKSLRIIPYYFGVGVDISLDDGAGSVMNEATYNNQRINRLFDDFVSGTRIDFLINGNTVDMFPGSAQFFPLDVWFDSIMYKHPAKIETLSCRVLSRVINDLTTGALVAPNVKVMIECYLI